MSKSPIHNISFLVSGRILDNLVTLFYYSMTARFLGCSDFGVYIYAITVSTLITTIADIGLTRYALKEIAKNASWPHLFFGQSVIFLTTVQLIAILSAAAGYAMFCSDTLVWHITIIITLGQSFFCIGNFYLNYFRAHEEMDKPAYITLLFKIFLLVSVIPGIWQQIGIYWFAFAYLSSSIIFTIVSVWFTHLKKGAFSYKTHYSEINEVIRQSFPFGLINMLGMLNFQPIPVFLLYFFHSKSTLGYFGASFRLIDAICFFSYAVSIGLFPVFVRLFKSSTGEILVCFNAAQKILLCIIIPACAGIMLLREKCIIFFYGPEYYPSIKILSILIWFGYCLFLNCLYSTFLQAIHQNKKVILNTLSTILIQCITGIVLVSHFKDEGAAYTLLAGHFTGYAIFCLQIRSYFKWIYFHMIWKIIAAVFIMSVCVICLFHLHFIPLVIIGAAVYSLSLYLLKPFHADELKWLSKKSILIRQ